MPRPVHFEIHAADTGRARRFYSELFGWKFEQWPGPQEYWLITTGPDGTPGINGGMVKRMGEAPKDGQALNGYACTVGSVDSVDAIIAKGITLGGVVALPKMAIPGVGWLAYLKDTEGNIFGVMQDDKTAK
jgi:predicted enzyme related to lactoylglutathione lyase